MSSLNKTVVDEFVAFVQERHLIYERRAEGLPPPWTEDPILATYKFTNVYRENDRVTQWIYENWMQPHLHDPYLWFALCVARIVNWPPSLEAVGYMGAWAPGKFIKKMAARAESGEQTFTGAYMINQSIPGGKGVPKHEYVANFVLNPIWERRKYLQPVAGEKLEAFHERLCSVKGFGSFMAAQVVADAKYAPALKDAPDWTTFAAPGPGSLRGLNVVCGRPPDAPWAPLDWKIALLELALIVNKRLCARGRKPAERVLPRPLDAQNVQNCLCEFSKYKRGYSRSKFKVFE